MNEPDYDNPECFQTFYECSEQKKWELYKNIKLIINKIKILTSVSKVSEVNALDRCAEIAELIEKEKI